MYQHQLKEAGCLNEQKELVMDRYREAFEKGNLDLQLLCSALGTQQIDEKFMRMKIVTTEHL